MDCNGKWTSATVIAASHVGAAVKPPPPPSGVRAAAPPPPAAAAAVAAAYQTDAVAEDSDEGETDLSSSTHPNNKADSGSDLNLSIIGGVSGGDLESMGEAELSTYVNDQVGGLLSFEEFKDALIRGIQVVKFNRRGAAAFRTLTLLGDHTLTWTTPKEVCVGAMNSAFTWGRAVACTKHHREILVLQIFFVLLLYVLLSRSRSACCLTCFLNNFRQPS